jgi:capsular exopolysaccharide synthesis family protein
MDRVGNFISLSLAGTNPTDIASVLNAVMSKHVALAAELKRAKLDEERDILEGQLGLAAQELSEAEAALEGFRVSTITLPSDQVSPVVPGLEMTRGSVFSSFFELRLTLDAVRRDRDRLLDFLDSVEEEGVRIEVLESITRVGQSSELTPVLGELVGARGELRVFRERYSDDYPPVAELLERIETIEAQTVPNLVRALASELSREESKLQAQIDSASTELSEIPPRTIEEARLQRRVEIQATLYNTLRQRVETARLAAASSIPDVRILDNASVPLVSSSDERLRTAGVVFLGCVGLSLLLALMMDRIDPKLRDPADVSTKMGLEILGAIPRISSNGRGTSEKTAQVVEAFRELRMRIGFAHGAAGPVILTVTSPSQGEGKSFITTNLAVAFAEMGRRTLLIDADTRRGDAHRLLGLERSPGLTDYLRDRTAGDVIQSTEYPTLDYIACGTRGTSTPELLASTEMASFMGTLRRAYDVILVDSPPLAAGADPLILAGLTGNLVVVIRSGSTERQLAEAKLEVVNRLPVRVLGAILNDIDPHQGVYRYYYDYLPDYHAEAEESDEAVAKALAETVQG